MFCKIFKGVLEPRVGLGRLASRGRRIHIGAPGRNEGILQNQAVLLNQNVVKLKREDARRMLELLSLRNPYSGNNRLTFVSQFIRQEKKQYPGNAFLLRNGDSYEAFDVDAVLFVEHCGLQFLGDTPHVSFNAPEFTQIMARMADAGVTVNVYEEMVNSGPLAKDVKSYFLSGIYTPTGTEGSSPGEIKATEDEDVSHFGPLTIDLIENRGELVVGLGYDDSGYSLSLTDLSGKVRVYEQLNDICVVDAINRLRSRLVMLQDNSGRIRAILKNLVNIVHYHVVQGNYRGRNFHLALLQELKNRVNYELEFEIEYTPDVTDVFTNTGRSLRSIVTTTQTPSTTSDQDESSNKEEDGTKIDSEQNYSNSYLDFNFISYLGDIVSQIVPSSSYNYVKRYFKQLVYRCPLALSDKIRQVNKMLSNLNVGLMHVKTISNYPVFGVPKRINASSTALDNRGREGEWVNFINNLNAFKYYQENLPAKLNQLLFDLVMNDLRVRFKRENLMSQLRAIEALIGDHLSPELVANFSRLRSSTNDSGDALISFLLDKERGCKVVKSEMVSGQMGRVKSSLNKLLQRIYSSYINSKDLRSSSAELTHQIAGTNSLGLSEDGLIYLKELNDKVDHTKLDSIQVVCGNKLIDCFVNRDVNLSLAEYLNDCNLLNFKVNQVLDRFHLLLNPYGQAIQIILHYLVVLQGLNEHVTFALSNWWSLVTPREGENKLTRDGKPVKDSRDAVLSILLANLGLYSPLDPVSHVSPYNHFMYLNWTHFNHNGLNIPDLEKWEKALMVVNYPPGDLVVKKMAERKSILVYDQSINSSLSQCQFDTPTTTTTSSSSTNCSGNGSTGEDAAELEKMIKKIGDAKLRQGVRTLVKSMLKVTQFKISRDLVFLGQNNVPPPRFAQTPVVYLLMLNLVKAGPITATNNDSGKKGTGREKFVIYVGETGDVIARLNRHRTREPASLKEYLRDQFIDYNHELDRYLQYLFTTANNSSTTTTAVSGAEKPLPTAKRQLVEAVGSGKELDIDFKGMNVLLLRLKTRREAKVVEKALIQLLYTLPDKFILLSHRDGQFNQVPCVD